MKYIVILVLTASIFYGCGNDKTENNNSQEGTGIDSSVSSETVEEVSLNVSDKDQLYDLSYKFRKDDNFKYEFTTTTSNSQIIEADSILEMDVKQVLTYVFDFNVLNILDDESADIRIKAESIKTDVTSSQGESLHFDSELPLTDADRIQYFQYVSFLNKPFQIRITPKGIIKEVSKTENIVNEMLKIQGIIDSIDSARKNQIIQNFNQSTIRPLAQQLFRTLPDSEIGIDSTWKFDYPSVFIVYQLQNTASFRLADIIEIDNEKNAKIHASLDISWDGQKEYTEQGMTFNYSDPKGSGKGFIYFNLDKNLVQKTETEVNMEYDVTMKSLDASGNPVEASKTEISTVAYSLYLL